MVPPVRLELTHPQRAIDFESIASTIPPRRHKLIFVRKANILIATIITLKKLKCQKYF